MKKILSTVLGVFLLFGQAMAGEQAQVGQDSGSPEEQKEQQSYSLGYRTGIQVKRYTGDLDPETFSRGFRAGFAGDKAALTEQEMRDAIRSFRAEMQARHAERRKVSAGESRREGAALLAENATREGAEPAAASDIRFAFKLDPRLSGGTYGGERWVSPPTYTGLSAQNTVEVRAGVFDAAGMPMNNIIPEWIPDNPALVSVAPGDGQRVRITVHGAGESRLKVTANGASRELSIKAIEKDDVIRLEITQ